MMTWLQSAAKVFRCGILLSALAAGKAGAENSQVTYPPVPDWVQEIAWKPAAGLPVDSKSAGTRYLVYEFQERPKQAEEFTRVVELMENENGVQDSGSLRLSFDAEFQELQIHRVRVHRGGQTIDRLNPAKVRVIQREDELESHMINGRKTAVLIIEDLRVGDVLEYAYTIRGANPVLGGHYSTRFQVDSDGPVDRELFRVLWDEKNPLQQRLSGTVAPPVTTPTDTGWDYRWNFTNLPVVPYEDRRPADFEPFAHVEVSDYADWGSVVNWALPLYETNPTNIPAELHTLVSQWQSSAPSNEEKARLALEFVQDDLRYTGIELGPDSYRPANPVESFQKRYADCKGKVVLLGFLLKQMGIESSPALVNSYVLAAVANRLPTPFAFNHVILQVRLDGKVLWLDPTYSRQGGALSERHLPAYGRALVIAPGNRDLTEVPGDRPNSAHWQKVTANYAVKDYARPVAFTVRTEYHGASADDMRDEIAGTPAADRAKNYLNYYAKLYPSIGVAAPLKVSDDRRVNSLVVEESYFITNLWQPSDEDKIWRANFYSDNLNNHLPAPNTRLRKTPLALSFPSYRQQHITVQLPDSEWEIPEARTNIEHAAFSFSGHRLLHGRTVTYDYECRSKLASLPAEMIPSYLATLDRMEDQLADVLQRPDAKSADGINWLMVVIAGFGLVVTVIILIWWWRIMTAASAVPPVIAAHELQGLGGWLLLVGLNLCLAPVLRLHTLGTNWKGYFSNDVWQLLAMPHGEKFHPLYAPMVIGELLANIFLLGLNLLVLFLFFGKRRAFPKTFIILVLASAVFLTLDDIGCGMIPWISADAGHAKGMREAIRAAFYALIWTYYMMKSRRVKATFVR